MSMSIQGFMIAVLALCIATRATAQTDEAYEAFKKKREQEMHQFQTAQQHTLDSLREAQNRDFGLLLEGKWSERKVDKTPEATEKPKPTTPPRFSAIDSKKAPEKIAIDIPRELKKSQPIELPQPSEPTNTAPENAPIEKSAPMAQDQLEQTLKGLNTRSINYYGTSTLAPSLSKWPKTKMPVNPENIADYWKRCAAQKDDVFFRYLTVQIESMHLSDWGIIQLMDQWIEGEQLADADRALFKWYWCIQLGYDVRLMYQSNQIILGYPFREMFYGQPYMTFGDVKYFLLDNPATKRVYTYEGKHAGAKEEFTLTQNPQTTFPDSIQSRIFHFTFENKEYSIPLSYNKYRTQYYSDIPLTDLSFYFSQPGANAWSATAFDELRSVLAGFPSERQRIRFLYAMVNDGIQYETDAAQFNKEKACMPEEVLSYTYADCEDRTFLLNYLITQLVGVRTIGLRYPSHVAMALELKEVKPSDATITYDGHTFVFCDPTYIGADVGMMPEVYEDVTPKVFE